MRKAEVLQHPVGTAAHVLAHAAWQRSRGRRPSMGYLSEKDPRRALTTAEHILRAQRSQAELKGFMALVGASLLHEQLDIEDMNESELKAAVTSIVAASSSEEEIIDRLATGLGLLPGDYSLTMNLPSDATGREALDLVKALGGLVTAHGAMVMIMIYDHHGETLFF